MSKARRHRIAITHRWSLRFLCLLAIATGAAVMLSGSVATPVSAATPLSPSKAEQVARDYLRTHALDLGLTPDDLADVVVKSLHASAHTGLTHVYLRQRFQGVEVAGADVTLNVTADARVHMVAHRFLSDLSARIEPALPSLSMAEAVARVGSDVGSFANAVNTGAPPALVYQPIADGSYRLAWEVVIDAQDRAPGFFGAVAVDAVGGDVLARTSWSSDFVPRSDALAAPDRSARQRPDDGPQSMNPDSYQVFAIPKEHPDDGPRTVEVNPALAGGPASLFNWHDTDGVAGAEFTITQGNNAYAYTDLDANNVADAGSSPDGGGALIFSFPLNLALDPSTYRPAAVTNAFYWTNIMHDVLWSYGFDEPAGSFQVNNYGRGGLGNDPVLVEVQDGSGVNNANITSPPDGQPARMQLMIWNAATPDRDAALANGVIADVYTYAIAERLVGGPVNVCLGNAEGGAMRWGWSDWVGLVLTAIASDTGPTVRGVGTYLANQAPDGPGIRVRPYTTNFAVNELTYGHLPSLPVPHGVGTVWGTMLWEMYWELVAIHGFNPDIYGDWSTGGNNLALQLVIDGMKLGPCNPGFEDGRNAILAADQVLTGGTNQCAIWRAFARRGLGFSASQGSSNSVVDGIAAFDLPVECQTAAVEGASSSQPPRFDPALRAQPNPFNPQTRLSFVLQARGHAALEIYDLQGRLVRQIEVGALPAGLHEIAWDGRGGGGRPLASGEYVIRLTVDGRVAGTRKTMLVK